MFRIEQLSEEHWAIIDRSDAVLFKGTLPHCEDWLDQQENLRRSASARNRWWRRLGRMCARFFSGGRDDAEHNVVDSDDKSDENRLDEVESTPAA